MSPPRAAGTALWLAFAGLVVAGGWLFLRACALDALGLDFCPVRSDGGALRREAATGDDLARQVHMAAMDVAETPICAPSPVVTPPTATPRPTPPASAPPPLRAETETIDRRVVERGGRNGRLQFTLEWATLDDLDLNVACSGGQIDGRPGHAGPGICGDGRKDIDANRNLVENLSSSPIENVVWQDDIPSGIYEIEVNEYMANGTAGNTVPFTLRLRWNGQERVCKDSVTVRPKVPVQREGDRVVFGLAKYITWKFGESLPACIMQTRTTYSTPPQK